jgi:small-conductance mechanosensitive channel
MTQDGSSVDAIIDLSQIATFVTEIEHWLYAKVLVVNNLVQLGVILLAFLIAQVAAKHFRRFVEGQIERRQLIGGLRTIAETVTLFPLPIVWLLLLWLVTLVASFTAWPHPLIQACASLISLWIMIRLISSLVRHPVLSKILAVTVFAILGLNALGLLDDAILLLDSAALTVGGLRVSLLTVIKGVLSLFVLLWAAIEFSATLERRIHRLPNLAPSVQVLLGKLLKITLIVIAILVSLSYVGIDLTAFAVFSGAVGVGIGFGLQKVVSNLISGFILLLDKSIKPGDIIEVGGNVGYISSLGARYVSIDTQTGREILIPNEEMITQRVVNWSYSNRLLMIDAPLAIVYGADIRRAMKTACEAALSVRRVLRQPPPACLLAGFGERSVNLTLSFWIDDPQNGIAGVKSEVLLAVWDRFQAQAIEMPYIAGATTGRPATGADAPAPTLAADEKAGQSDARPARIAPIAAPAKTETRAT